jgi:hypothetical protein
MLSALTTTRENNICLSSCLVPTTRKEAGKLIEFYYTRNFLYFILITKNLLLLNLLNPRDKTIETLAN